MSSHVQNYGFSKIVSKSGRNEVEWMGDYDGSVAKIIVNENNNGHKDSLKMRLTTKDLMDLLTAPSVNKELDKRLLEDFDISHYKPTILNSALINKRRVTKRRPLRRNNKGHKKTRRH